MNLFTFETINDGYVSLVERLLLHPDDYEEITLKGAGTGNLINKKSRYHLRNVHIEFKRPDLFTEFVVKDVERSKVMNQYAQKETIFFDNGIIDSNQMGEISKIWKYIENPDETINANYGYMVYHLKDARVDFQQTERKLSQWEWCQFKLKQNIHTLQAYMHFNRPKDQFTTNLDQPCTMYCQFMVVGNRLHFISNMRSNDVIYGTPYNLSYFVKLQSRMLHYLNTECGHQLEWGSLFHNATSIHLYKDKLPLAKKICGF